MESDKEEHVSTVTTPRLYRASEVARLLGVSKERVRELVATGELRSVRLGGTGWHRFRPDDIERIIAGEG
jgi:excisionase family DNA binding protein